MDRVLPAVPIAPSRIWGHIGRAARPRGTRPLAPSRIATLLRSRGLRAGRRTECPRAETFRDPASTARAGCPPPLRRPRTEERARDLSGFGSRTAPQQGRRAARVAPSRTSFAREVCARRAAPNVRERRLHAEGDRPPPRSPAGAGI